MDRRDRFNEYSRRRRQATPRELRYEDDHGDYFYEYRQPYFDREESGYEPREPEWRERMRRDRERYRRRYPDQYGEHPGSRGREEYLGSNKRQSGFGHSRSAERGLPPSYSRRREDRSFERRHARRDEPRHVARKEYDEYLERGQYEIPFHQRDIYDPVESGYENEYLDERRDLDYMYRDEGYQSRGRIDGFGRSSRRRSPGDWRYEDEYRHGHAMKSIGSGKYGAR